MNENSCRTNIFALQSCYLIISEWKHQKKRINFVKDWKDYTFEDVWITDECVFQLHRNRMQVWSSKKYPRPTKAVPKFDQKIMVWGALSYRGFYLKILGGKATIDSQKYCQILAEFVPYADALYEEGWILQQDGATPHTSAKTKNWLSENNIQFLQWPPSSADLSLFENVWQILKNEVEKKTPKNVPELREKIQESQHILTSEMKSNLMNSVSVRLNEVISSKRKQIRL